MRAVDDAAGAVQNIIAGNLLLTRIYYTLHMIRAFHRLHARNGYRSAFFYTQISIDGLITGHGNRRAGAIHANATLSKRLIAINNNDGSATDA